MASFRVLSSKANMGDLQGLYGKQCFLQYWVLQVSYKHNHKTRVVFLRVAVENLEQPGGLVCQTAA